jgi:large subunit ribosomal protein L32e
MVETRLLEQRKEMNKRRPKFLRQNYHFRKKVQDDFWRAPKGYHSKMRMRIHGHRKVVLIGYRNPEEVRGLHKSGAKFFYVAHLSDLEKFNPKTEVGILSGKIGDKKRYEILKAAVQKKLSFVNINAEKFVTNIELKMKAKKEMKSLTVKQKSEAKAAEKKPEPKVEAPKAEVKPKTQFKPEAKKQEKAK